jgi:hypothetical protein
MGWTETELPVTVIQHPSVKEQGEYLPWRLWGPPPDDAPALNVFGMDDRADRVVERPPRGALEGLTVDDDPTVKLLRPTKNNRPRGAEVLIPTMIHKTSNEME